MSKDRDIEREKKRERRETRRDGVFSVEAT
jgi:hypothetical protein